MPTVDGKDAALIGVKGTLELISNSGPNINIRIDVASANDAIADGVATNRITITLTDDSNTAIPNKKVTITPTNPELLVNGVQSVVELTTDENGKAVADMSSTYASWLGKNMFTVASEGYTKEGESSFSLYVDKDKSFVTLDKDILYNNGKDKITATYKALDKLGRAIPADLLTVIFQTTDEDPSQVITPNGYNATVSTENKKTTDYFLSVKMTNYDHGWQPEAVKYTIMPESGIWLAKLIITPKLCATSEREIRDGMRYSYCSPTDGVPYYHSGLGFLIELTEAAEVWDKQLTLHSSEIDGAIMVTSNTRDKKGNFLTQNCSLAVTETASWMNDFGDKNTHNLELSFLNNAIIDTFKTPGYIDPVMSTGGGGVGACDVITSNYQPLKPQLLNSGNVHFTAITNNPKSQTDFKVPLAGSRIDIGLLNPQKVTLYFEMPD